MNDEFDLSDEFSRKKDEKFYDILMSDLELTHPLKKRKKKSLMGQVNSNNILIPCLLTNPIYINLHFYAI